MPPASPSPSPPPTPSPTPAPGIAGGSGHAPTSAASPGPGPQPQPPPTPTPPPGPADKVQRPVIPPTPRPQVRGASSSTSSTTPAPPAADGGSNLALGVNERYRAAIELAAQRTGLNAAAIAAIINVEAGGIGNRTTKTQMTDEALSARHPDRDFKKQPLDAKDPKDAELIKEWKELYKETAWDPNSHNASGAAGLTQFLAGTWHGEAERANTYLNQVAVEKGYVKDGHVVPGKEADLLKLRYDATISIVAGAEYDKSVFDQLGKETVKSTQEADRAFSANHPDRDFNAHPLSAKDPKDAELIKEWKAIYTAQPGTPLIPKDLTDDQKAKYIYLGHHDGPPTAEQILRGTLTDSPHVLDAWEKNVPEEDRERLLTEHGSVSKAYTAWTWGGGAGDLVARIAPDHFRR